MSAPTQVLPAPAPTGPTPRRLKTTSEPADRAFAGISTTIGMSVLAITGAIGLFLGYQSIPTPDGLTAIMKPLLVAWAEKGAGQTNAALSSLQAQANAPGLRTVFSLHIALIADQANLVPTAAQNYGIVQGSLQAPNLRLAQLHRRGDHREHDAYITQHAGAENRAQLRFEHVEVGEAEPDRAAAEEWIVLRIALLPWGILVGA